MDCFSLSKLHTYIRRVISINFPEPIWVRAEIFNVVLKSGHYYIELGEKSDADEIIAQGSAVIWKSQVAEISKLLHSSPSNLLKTGNEIMFRAHVDFHIRYGLKLQILELNKEFSLGLIALQRQKTIQRLKEEGLWQKNKSRLFPYHIKNIALLASKSSAAFADFMDQLQSNEQGYRFHLDLFNVAVQGMLSAESIQKVFQKIANKTKTYDLVVIIRGGGSKHDLSDFDHYDIAEAISKCSFPVITGIGHQTDESIADQSAYLSLKTPTAVAEFILQHTFKIEAATFDLLNEIFRLATVRHHTLVHNLHSISSSIQLVSQKNITNKQLTLYKIEQSFQNTGNGVLLKCKERIHQLELLVRMNDPEAIFDKGYSLSTVDGMALYKHNTLHAGQELITKHRAGIVKSKITEVWEKEK